jgi:pimeloyl-ACP methyl ester carboxylesterase
MTAELNHVRRGSGPPLLLLHSLGGTITQWNPVIDLLAAEREVIAVDMPGFGGSPELARETEPTSRNLAAAVLEFVDSLGLGAQPGAAGISLGAWVAIECGRQGGVNSVVGLCPAGFWKEPLGPRGNGAHNAARLLGPLMPLLLRNEGMRRRALASNFRHPERISVADAVAIVRGYGGARGYPRANHFMRSGVVGDLSDVPVPVTLAWAEHDTLVRPRPLKEGVLPAGVRQVSLPGCGHVPTWDDPELVTWVILEGTAKAARASSGRGHERRPA